MLMQSNRITGQGCCHALRHSCDSGRMSDAMTEVLEARQAFDTAREQASAMVARKRAALGLAMIRARKGGGESQSTIARDMKIGPQQVRAYEQAYRDWVEKHPGEEP